MCVLIDKAGELCFIGLRIVCSSVQQLDGEAPSGMYRNRSKSHPEVLVQYAHTLKKRTNTASHQLSHFLVYPWAVTNTVPFDLGLVTVHGRA